MSRTLTLEDLPLVMTAGEAATAVEVHVETIRRAIRQGNLEAFIPRGRDTAHAGRGQGYRITRESLARWYLNVPEAGS